MDKLNVSMNGYWPLQMDMQKTSLCLLKQAVVTNLHHFIVYL